MILVAVVAVVFAALMVRLAVPAIRRHRMARELRGDWWPRFEREFRAYSNRFAQAARESEWNR